MGAGRFGTERRRRCRAAGRAAAYADHVRLLGSAIRDKRFSGETQVRAARRAGRWGVAGAGSSNRRRHLGSSAGAARRELRSARGPRGVRVVWDGAVRSAGSLVSVGAPVAGAARGGVAVGAVGPGAAAVHTGNLTTVCSCRRGRRKGSAAAAVRCCRRPYVTRLDSAVWRGVTSGMRSAAVRCGRSRGPRRPRRS